MLDQYEDEYRAHASDTLAKLETAESASHRDDRHAPTAAAACSLDAAKEVMELLEMECGALPKAQRTALSARVRSYRSELGDLGRRLKALQRVDARAASAASADSIREDLFSGANDQASERSRMLATNDRLAAGTDQLRQAHAATIDMEERGASIMGDLARQRDTLMRTRGTLGAAREGLDASRRILQQMGRRASTNKLMLRAIAGTVLLLLLFLLWPASQAATSAPPPPTSLAVHPKAARHGRQ